MSATGRGAARSPADYYPTPEWCTRALADWLDRQRMYAPGIIDPCAGDGAVLRVVHELWPRRRLTGLELRDVPAPEGVPCVWSTGRSSLDLGSTMVPGRLDAVVTNPPYSLAKEFITAWAPRVEWSAWLLRLNFLGSQKRTEWLRSMPSAWVLVLPRRPSFTGDGTDMTEYAWMVWQRGNTTRPWVDWLEVTP